MAQIALPLTADRGEPGRIIVGSSNAAVIESCRHARRWPFQTAVLTGNPRSGKSLIGRWFADQGLGQVVDDAHLVDETTLFHRWNRAQQEKVPLLLINGMAGGQWRIQLPDLASRLGAAALLDLGPPDEAMMAELLTLHAAARGLALGPDAAAYLVPRCERSHLAIELLVGAIDRISLERKVAPTMGIWREALEQVIGPHEPRLL